MPTITKSPVTMADDGSVGTIAWNNPDNAKVSDNIYAQAIHGSGGYSHYLKATNFGFSIPTDATIDGIVVEIERSCDSSDPDFAIDSEVKIVKFNGTIGTENKADTVNNWPITDTYKSYGSSSDLWSESWSASDINNSNFGVVLSVLNGNDGPELAYSYVDHIRITIYYTEWQAFNSPLPTFFIT